MHLRKENLKGLTTRFILSYDINSLRMFHNETN